MSQDARDDRPLFNERDQAQPAATPRTAQDVEGKDPPQEQMQVEIQRAPKAMHGDDGAAPPAFAGPRFN